MAKVKLIDLYKSLNDIPLHEQFPEDDEYAKHMKSSSTQMTGDAFNKKDLASVGKYDPGNEPLEIQYHGDQQLYYIEAEDIEAYVNGETVVAVDPDRGGDEIDVNRDNSDVTGVSEDELEDFMVSGDRSADGLNEQGPRPDYADVDGDGDEEESMEKAFKDKEKMDEYGCSEQEIEEGTCGHAPNGEVDVHNTHKMKPASSRIKIIALQERFQKLANIKKS